MLEGNFLEVKYGIIFRGEGAIVARKKSPLIFTTKHTRGWGARDWATCLPFVEIVTTKRMTLLKLGAAFIVPLKK